MKKLIISLLIVSILSLSVLCVPVGATSATKTTVTIEYLDNGDYIETEIVENTLARATKTATKYHRYKNSSGEVMWYIAITGTFTYTGTTSLCTACSHEASSNNQFWSIRSASSTRSKNVATGKAVARHTYTTNNYQDYSATVTLTCSKDGTLS